MPRLIDLTGRRFGKWTVLGLAPKDKNGHTMWRCLCDCGTEKIISGLALKSGRTKSCGCIKSLSLVGQKFGRLTVVSETGKNKYGDYLWECVCDCGNRKIIPGAYLKNGHTQSCGCFSRERSHFRNATHGQSNSRLYGIWHGMKARCYRNEDQNYQRYGGRGIQICDEWKNDFSSFFDWSMSHGYSDDLSIDRIDNDGGYAGQQQTNKPHSNGKRGNSYHYRVV